MVDCFYFFCPKSEVEHHHSSFDESIDITDVSALFSGQTFKDYNNIGMCLLDGGIEALHTVAVAWLGSLCKS